MSGNGIDAGGTETALIEGNTLDNCQTTGIKLVNGSAFQAVRDNFVSRCGLTSTWLTPGSSDLSIHDCVVDNKTITRIGEGIGMDYFGWFGNTTPAGIHLDRASSFGGRCRDNIVTNNVVNDGPEMEEWLIIRGGRYRAINTTLENNSLALEAPPEDREACADSILAQGMQPSSWSFD